MSSLKDTRDLIRELAELLDKTSLTEIEVEDDAVRIRVARQPAAQHVSAAVHAQAPALPVQPAVAAAPPETAAAEIDPKDHPGAVTSPMVGTVYLSPEPGAPAFKKVGDKVAVGDTMLIIEAMKVMNPIPAPRAGTLTSILVSDSQPVEFGELLLIIE